MSVISLLKSARIDFYIKKYRSQPLENNKIILWSNNLKSYGCNPKYITEYLIKNYPGKFNIVWVFNEETEIPIDLPAGVRAVRYFSLEYLKELHTAKFIICNARISPALMFKKRKGQFYIQTWHSSIRLKKIEGDANLPKDYVDLAKNDSGNIDLIISGCKFSSDTIKRAFWYDGKILECGTPRCDMLFDKSDSIRKKVFDFYGIDESKKTVLYAPTFRKDYSKNDYGLDYKMLINALEKRFGGSFVLLVRFHPNVTASIDAIYSDAIINATKYPDMQELVTASDVLVTDYSSCMFDAVIADKPCFLFTKDLDEYISSERALYFSLEELPFTTSKSNHKLSENILSYKDENKDIYKEFLNKVGSFENGTACRQIAEIIISEAGK